MPRHSSLLTIVRNGPAALELTLHGVFEQQRQLFILGEAE